MSRKAVKILSTVSGVILIAAGIYCLVREDAALVTGALLLGVSMLASGVAELVIFAKWGGSVFGSGWLLLDGILTVIMSLFLLFNRVFTLLYLPFLFSAWLLFSGIFRLVSAIDLRSLGVPHWGLTLSLSVIFIIVGFLGFIDPWVSLEAISVTVGLVFVLEGIDTIAAGFNSHVPKL